MKFDVQIKQSELSVSSEIVSDKSLCFVVNFPMLKGKDGRDGFTWRPTVNAEGDLSWSDDSSTTPPPSINVMGNDGVNGKDALINGVNTLTIKEGENVKVSQLGSELTISSEINEVVRTEINGKADKPIAGRSFLTPLFIARGAVFNDVTGFYELNGILDIGEEEMMGIYTLTGNFNFPSNQQYAFYPYRTNFKNYSSFVYYRRQPSLGSWFSYSIIEVLNVLSVNSGLLGFLIWDQAFFNCRFLHTIIGGLGFVNNASAISVFSQCYELQNVNIHTAISLSLSHSSKLTLDSIIYILINRGNDVNKPITITLHPTVFAVASTNPDVQTLLPATTTKGEVLLASA